MTADGMIVGFLLPFENAAETGCLTLRQRGSRRRQLPLTLTSDFCGLPCLTGFPIRFRRANFRKTEQAARQALIKPRLRSILSLYKALILTLTK